MIFAVSADLILYSNTNNISLKHMETHLDITESVYKIFNDRVVYINKECMDFPIRYFD